MSGAGSDDALAGAFEQQRVRLVAVAYRAQREARAAVTGRPVLINGEPGVVTWGANGKPLGGIACTVIDGRIVEILSVNDPKRIAAMDLQEGPGI